MDKIHIMITMCDFSSQNAKILLAIVEIEWISTIYNTFRPDLLRIKSNVENSMFGHFRMTTWGYA